MDKTAYIKLWLDYRCYFETLSDAEVGRLVRAMLDYEIDGATPKFSGSERVLWPVMRRNIDIDHEFLEKQAKNGSKGGRPRKPKETQQNPRKPKETQQNPEEPKETQQNPEEPKETQQNQKEKIENRKQKIEYITTTTTAQARESWQQCVDCYEQNIGALPRAAFDSIVGYLEQVEPDLVCEAINQSAINNKRSWGYAQAILRDCLQKNITTRAAYLAEKEARSQQKGAAQRQQMKTTQEKLWEIAKGGMADDLSADGGASVAGHELLG
jgi:DnaD/phage-associated family protein